MILYQLTRPFGYLSIKGIKGKFSYDWLFPVVLTTISMLFFILSNGSDFTKITGEDGLISELTGFIANLPGFYIAALAAIATFNREQIDHLLISDGESPYVIFKGVNSNGREIETKERITRRLFLCFLFAFLTAESFLLVIFAKFSAIVVVPTDYLIPLSYMYASIYFLFFWQLVVSTFFGLYYLGNRIHCTE